MVAVAVAVVVDGCFTARNCYIGITWLKAFSQPMELQLLLWEAARGCFFLCAVYHFSGNKYGVRFDRHHNAQTYSIFIPAQWCKITAAADDDAAAVAATAAAAARRTTRRAERASCCKPQAPRPHVQQQRTCLRKKREKRKLPNLP